MWRYLTFTNRSHHSTVNKYNWEDSTLADTCMLLSCMVMMASEILMSTGSTTASMLKGPSSLSATSNMASVKTRGGHMSAQRYTHIQTFHYFYNCLRALICDRYQYSEKKTQGALLCRGPMTWNKNKEVCLLPMCRLPIENLPAITFI